MSEQFTLAERLKQYLNAREHTLSTDGLPWAEQMREEAAYIISEACELQDAVRDMVWSNSEQLAPGYQLHVRNEIADVVLAATCLAGIFGVNVEDCIIEKTEQDRGRG